jgi:hypothetical protein
MAMRSVLQAVSRRLEVHCLIPQCSSSWKFSFDQDRDRMARRLAERGWTYQTDQPTILGPAHGWMCPDVEAHEEIFTNQRSCTHGR